MQLAGRHAARRGHRVGRVTVVLGVGLAVLAGGGAGSLWAATRQLQNNITTIDVRGRLGTDRPAPLAVAQGHRGPVNILVLGSDSRLGANDFVGGKQEQPRSDTTLLLHLAADRRSALAVSIPRDSMVDLPDCVDDAGVHHPGGLQMFNSAYETGGVGCTQRAVEQLTGIRIDHFVVVDFAGFADVVDALGPVEVCLPEAVDDPKAGLSLPAGRSRVSGKQALAYVRERHKLGDGGDLGRIRRQHAFLASVLQQATSRGMLSHPDRLYAFLSAGTRSLTMDPDLARLGTMVGLGRDLGGIGLSHIRFLTVPVGAYAPDPNRLAWTPAADDLWRAIRQDRPVLTDDDRRPTPSGSPSASGSSPSGEPSGPASPSASASAEPTGKKPVVVAGVSARSADAGICDSTD